MISTSTSQTSQVSEAKFDDSGDGFVGVPSEVSGVQGIVCVADAAQQAKVDDSSLQERLNYGTQETEEQGEKGLPEGPKRDGKHL